MKNQLAQGAVFLGRVLIAVLFLGGAFQKANDPVPAMALLLNFGLAAWLVWPAVMFNALVGVALIAGVQVRGAALRCSLRDIAPSQACFFTCPMIHGK
jgi:putative oxidoreductase